MPLMPLHNELDPLRRGTGATPPLMEETPDSAIPGRASSVRAAHERAAGPLPAPVSAAPEGPQDVGGRHGEGAPRIAVGGVPVEQSDDAGAYYCEHALFVSLHQAGEAHSSIVRGSHGPLVGFLHLPADRLATMDPNERDAAVVQRAQVERQALHRHTQQVVGAALRGYCQEVQAAGAVAAGDPIRILLTGYQPFMSITNNPTGDFIQHRANITAALRSAYRDVIEDGSTETPAGVHGATTLRYRVGAAGQEWPLEVTVLWLPVSDAAIDPGNRDSVGGAMGALRPHAELSMGVNPNESSVYRVETRGTDAGLDRNRLDPDLGKDSTIPDKGWKHQDGRAATQTVHTSALWEAIRSGDAARRRP